MHSLQTSHGRKGNAEAYVVKYKKYVELFRRFHQFDERELLVHLHSQFSIGFLSFPSG